MNQNLRQPVQNQNNQTSAVAVSAPNPLGLPSQVEWTQIKEICNAAIKSGMLPAAIKSPEAAAIIALKSRELGIPLMVGFANIHVVNGKPAMSAELIQAQARKNLPGLVFNILETTNEKCVVEGQRPERGSRPLTVSFSIEDARKAALLSKDVWKSYPAAMLRARAVTACLRLLCPDALMGISYTPEELGLDAIEDIETTSRPVEPPKEAEPKAAPALQPVEGEPDPLKRKRSTLFRMWESGHGTKEGLASYLKESFGIQESSQVKNLTEENLNQIEKYISEQLNSRPPQPLDPQQEVALSAPASTPLSDEFLQALAETPDPRTGLRA